MTPTVEIAGRLMTVTSRQQALELMAEHKTRSAVLRAVASVEELAIEPESVEVAVYYSNYGGMNSRAGHDGPINLWRSMLDGDPPLPDGYYQIYAAPVAFDKSQRLRGELSYWGWGGCTARVESQLGNWTVPAWWEKSGELHVRIVKIDAPPTDEQVPDHLCRGSDWHCPWAPDRVCHYNRAEDPCRDECVYCGQPDERK